MPRAAVAEASRTQELVIRLEVDEALPGGLAIYGRRFGRYAVDPMLAVRKRRQEAVDTSPQGD